MAALTTGHSSNDALAAAAEQQARTFLEQGRWRKARDELKQLLKVNRDRYLPLLIEANIGLAREMSNKGLISEARQVLDYLGTIATPERLQVLKLDLAAQAGTAPPEESLVGILATLAEPTSSTPEEERQRLADFLVLAPQPGTGIGEVQGRILAEVGAVREALQAVAQSAWGRASDLSRSVPSRSPVRHWALFIKGLVAYYSGAPVRATEYFRNLTGRSVPAQAAHCYLILLSGGAESDRGATPTEAALEGVGQLLGVPGVGTPLTQADRAWKEGRLTDAYRLLRDGLRFPSDDPGGLEGLTEFFFNAPDGLNEAQRDNYVRYFEELIKAGKCRSRMERMMASRLIVLAEAGCLAAQELQDHWQTYLREHERLHGTQPRFASMALTWLGEQLSMVRPTLFFGDSSSEMRDAEGALAALREAIELDPMNRAAYRRLSLALEILNQGDERNRLTDRMTKQFPDDKETMLQAAKCSLDLRSFQQALDYLARAREIDPLDPNLSELIVITRCKQAREEFVRRTPDQAREAFALAEPFLTDQPDDFRRSRWTCRVREAVMETIWGDAVRGEALLTEAQAQAPRADACLLYAHLAYRSEAPPAKSPWLASFQRALRQQPTVPGIALLIRILKLWEEDLPELAIDRESDLVIGSLKAALRQPYDRSAAIDLMELARANQRWMPGCRKLVDAMLRQDPLDPRFRLYRLDARDRSDSHRAELADVQSILDEAVRRRDEVVARRARERLKNLENPTPRPWDDDLEPDQEGGSSEFDEVIPPHDGPEKFAMLGAMGQVLRNCSEAELEELRRTRPKGMPSEIFDELVRISRGTAEPVPPRPARGQPAPSRPGPKFPPASPESPNQMSLF